MTNTENKTTSDTPKTGRPIIARIVLFVITIVFIVILTVNLQLILKGSSEFGPIAYVIVAALYLIADSVRAGINMVISQIPVSVQTESKD